jgi:predicted AAA+ superfamily ATPase
MAALQDSGKRLEHAVLASILRCTPNVCYYRTAAGKELDFVFTDSDKNPRIIIQVTDDSEARIQSTEEGMKELGFNEACLVTSDEERDIKVESGTIHAISGWRFMLNAASIIG